MAKLWEVLKAFDEGTAVKAERKTTMGDVVVTLAYHGPANGVSFLRDSMGNHPIDSDFTSTDWDILERPDRHLFAVIYATFKIKRSGKPASISSVAYDDRSLLSVQQIMHKQYPDTIISVHAAMGVSESGAVTIIVEEGKMVE